MGGTWNQDDVIVFGRFGGGLLRVPSAGGEPTPVTTLDDVRLERSHWWPQFLPDGEHFLFLAMGAGQEGIYVGSLEAGVMPSLLLRTNRMGRYAAPGYLLFGWGQSLMAQPFDVNGLELTGDPVRVVDGVRSNLTFLAFRSLGFSVSHQGGLAYVGGGAVTQLRWVDRSGAELGTLGEPGDYLNPVVSPDETKVAVARDGDVWILDVSRGTEQRLTFDPAPDFFPHLVAGWEPHRVCLRSGRTPR